MTPLFTARANLLLTGASGYLGSRVADLLRREGVAFDALSGRLQDIAPGSLRYRHVLHCAGVTSLRGTPDFAETNTWGTACLLRGLAPDAQVVFVSTRKVYPRRADTCADESLAPDPWDDYGASKLEAEHLLHASGRKVVIFRAGAMFGHPARESKFPDLALQAALAGQCVTLATPPRCEDYLDVEQMARAMVRVCGDGPHWGRTFNITGPVRPLDGIVDALNRACLAVLGRTVAVRRQPMPAPIFPWLDVCRLHAFFPGLQQPDDEAIFTRMLRARLAGAG